MVSIALERRRTAAIGRKHELGECAAAATCTTTVWINRLFHNSAVNAAWRFWTTELDLKLVSADLRKLLIQLAEHPGNRLGANLIAVTTETLHARNRREAVRDGQYGFALHHSL